MNFIEEEEERRKEEIWQIISRSILDLEDPVPNQINLRNLLTHPIHKKLATMFLLQQKADYNWQILDCDQLVSIANKVPEADYDIDQVPGVYLFVSHGSNNVLKIGQTGDLRERISKGHLMYGDQMIGSKLIGFCKSQWDWPICLREQDISALMFPMRNSDEQERKFIEFGLQKLLSPHMP